VAWIRVEVVLGPSFIATEFEELLACSIGRRRLDSDAAGEVSVPPLRSDVVFDHG
jgi:hypothetical protein